MGQTPTVSVLMPVYNADRYVVQAVESILAQTFTDFEFIILDDGSTDASLKILQTYAAKDDRIRLISRENRGLVASLNEMIDLARGKYLARMDADDIALRDRFAAQIALLEREPDVVCVGSAYDMIDEQGDYIIQVTPPQDDTVIQQQLLHGVTAIQHPCAMIRRSTVLAVNGYDSRAYLAEDLDLWLRLGEVGRLANIDTVGLKYRVHPNSVSGRRIKCQIKVVRTVCRQAWKRRGMSGEAIINIRLWYHDFVIFCGWRAFNLSQRQECLSYGVRAVQIAPFNLESWRLLFCAVIKPLPKLDIEDDPTRDNELF